MAKTKTHKSLTTSGKGLIWLAILLAITVFVSYISVSGMKLDAEGVQVLLPWVPTSGENWPASLPLDRPLGGGISQNYAFTATPGNDQDEAMATALKIMKSRASQMNNYDFVIEQTSEGFHIETRKVDSATFTNLMNTLVAPGLIEMTDPDGNVVLTNKDITNYAFEVNSQKTYYILAMTLTDEAVAITEEAGGFLYMAIDGQSVFSYVYLDGNKLYTNNLTTQELVNSASNVIFWAGSGNIPGTFAAAVSTGTVEAKSVGMLTVAILVAAVLLAAALVYFIIIGKLTGISAILSVWAALMLNLFFYATVACLTTTVGCLIALLLGLILAIYTGLCRTKSISAQIGEGSAPKSASKLGFHAVAKHLWLVHGIVLAVGLILSIFKFSKGFGYTLCCGVAGSVMAMLVMRMFQACFTAICKKPALFGKAK